MSTYRFKKKEPEENRIMNASATETETTAVFSPPAQDDKSKDDKYAVFLPFAVKDEEKEDENNADSHISIEEEEDEVTEKSSDKPHAFNFNNFLKNINQEHEADSDIVEKVESIFNKKALTVSEIKDNLSSGKKIDLADVFSNTPKVPLEEEEEAEPELNEEAIDEAQAEDTLNDEVEDVSNEANDDLNDDAIEDADESLYDELEDDYEPEDNKINVIDFLKSRFTRSKETKELEEHLNRSDIEDFEEKYTKKSQLAVISFLATLLCTIALLYVETKFIPHPEWLMPGKYGVLFLMIDLQFVFITAICVLNSIIDGAKSLFTWKPNKNSILFVSFLIATLQVILHFIGNKFSKDILLYSSIFALCATVGSLTSLIEIKREQRSFRIVSQHKVKFIASKRDVDFSKNEKFQSLLTDNSAQYAVKKTSFASNFFKLNSQKSPYDETYKISIPLTIMASLIFTIIGATVFKYSNFSNIVNNFTLVFMMALPVSSFFITVLPFFATSIKLSRLKSTIIGEKSIEDLANTSLISLADTDMFNANGIKFTSIKTYGKSRIDNTYLIASRVFNLVGGPLKEVFNRSVIADVTDTSTDEVLSVASNGISATIDSHKVFIGNKEYMVETGYDYIDDTIDREFEHGNGKIMYIAIDDEVSAKFYVRYSVTKKFQSLLDTFSSHGVCMVINTRDPNLDTAFLTHVLKNDSYPIIIEKNLSLPTKDENMPSKCEESPIVCASSVTNFLRTILTSDKLSRIISINSLAKYISLVLAIILAVVALLADGSHEKITPIFILAYQFIWSLPVIATSFFA